MRKVYSAIAWFIAAGVVVQAASIAFGLGGLLGYVMEGGVVDKALVESGQATYSGDIGFSIHSIVGGLVLHVAALALGVVSFFVRGVPRAKTLAWAMFVLIFIQGSAGYMLTDLPYVGLFHGANALLVLVLAVYTARLASRTHERQVPADEQSSTVPA